MEATYIEKQELLPVCFNCGSRPIVFKSKNGRFQIRCQQCHIKTKWGKKTNVVIDWFNFFERGISYYATTRRTEKKDT